MSRLRVAVAALAALVALYLLASIRHLDAADQVHVLDAPLLRLAPRRVDPGWRLVPRLLARVSGYPASKRTVRAELSGARAAATRDGTRVEIEAVLTYSIPADRLLGLHRARGPGYEETWLAATLRRRTEETLRTAPYDLFRNRDPMLTRALKSVLEKDLDAQGVRIEGLRIAPVTAAAGTPGTILQADAQPLERKVVMLGVDSFDWRVIDPLLHQGRMPRLARLIARGARANLKTIQPILSPVVWTSIATGVKPSRHGIVDFVVTARDTGEMLPVTSAMRLVPALWTLLSRQGIDVDVVAWWATWPAETVRGRIVTDRVAFQLFDREKNEDWKSADPAKSRGKTFPPELFDTLRPMIKSPREVTDEEVAWFLPGGRFPERLTDEQRHLLNDFRTVIAAGETYHAMAKRLLEGSPHGLAMIYYEGPDTASHLFMRYRPPLLAGVTPRDMELFGGIVDRYYERQDRFIGEIVDQAGPDADVLVVSDHGFKSDTNRPPNSDPRIGKGNAADWHTPIGVLIAAGPGVREGAHLGSASVLDVAPTVLSLYGLPAARDMDGQPLAEALTPEFANAHPVAWIDSYGGARQPPEEEIAASADDPELLEKLRSLGYVGEERTTAFNNRGVIALDEGDVDAAIADFSRAQQMGDNGPMVRINLARAWMLKGDLDKAQALAEQVLKESGEDKSALLLLGIVEAKRDRLDAAEARLRRALGIDPTLVQARSKLGEILQKRGRDDLALEEYRKVIEIAPLSPIEHNNIGNILRKQGRIDEAMEAYREALRCDAQYIGACNNLGLCLQEKGRLDEAMALYQKALAIRPENPILRNSLGTLLALKGDKKAALAEFERARKADPDWPVAQGNLATLLFESGRIPEARPAFERWVAIEPRSIDARLGLALCLLTLQAREGAIEQFNEVLRLDPGNFRAHVALGETLMKAGDVENARTHLEAAAAKEQGVPRVLNSLGEVYLKLGLRKEAAQVFRRSLQIEPKQADIRQRLSVAAR
jgi:tetratricopeptide (TPR) repeat protein